MNIGDKAPEVLGINEKGEEILLSNYQGKKVVLYFYPKDNTSGCTAEACSLRDNYAELKAKGYEVIGVSVDNEKSHQKFIEKYELPFTLIADTDKKLVEAMGDLNDASIERAKEMVKEESVTVALADTAHKLYVKAIVTDTCGHTASAVIEDDHDRIVETAFCEEVLSSAHKTETAEVVQKSTLDYGLTVKEIFEFASNVAYEDIEFILESRTLNMALAEEGLNGPYGLKVGQAISSAANKEVFGGDFLCYAMALTAAASDARMAGCTLAAMSNSGSGNQGITVTMPVIAYSIKYGTTDEQLARALVLSHLIAIHIKGYLGKLSALCGCVIASTGSSCGLVYLRGGDYEQVCSAIKNMIGNITGMVCDGAKVGCAMKVASGVSSALQSAVLAREGMCISEHDGIIEKDIEKTIQNLGRIGSVGMQNTDNMILDIMVCK